MINQIVKIKLEKYYEAEKVNHPISSVLNFYDIINILCAVKKQRVNFINSKKEISKNPIEFNKSWEYLHDGTFKLIFYDTIREIFEENKLKTPFYSPNEEDIKEAMQKTTKEEFNKIFKILHSSNEYSLKAQDNINQTIYNFFPLVVEYLNQRPPEKYVDKENLKGDVGISTYDIK